MCWFKKPPLPPSVLGKPEKRVQVDSTTVFNIIRPFATADTAHVYLSDNDYWLCSKQDIVRFLAQDDTNKMQYQSEELDCDDFSYRLMGQLSIPDWSGIAFGIVWTDVHAFNCFIDEGNKLWFVEPQNGQIMDKIESYMGTEILLIVM